MRPHLLPLLAALLLPACSHSRTPMGEGCIDGTVRPADLHFIADGSGRHYTPLTADPGSPHLDLRPYAGQHLTICGPIDPQFRIHNARIVSPLR